MCQMRKAIYRYSTPNEYHLCSVLSWHNPASWLVWPSRIKNMPASHQSGSGSLAWSSDYTRTCHDLWKKKNQQPVIGSQWLDRPVALRLWRSRLWTGSGRSVDCPTYFWHEFLGISWVLQGCSEFCTCCRQLFFMNIHQKFQNHSIVKSKNKSCCRSTSRAWSCSSYRSSFRLRKWAQEIVHINSIFTWRIIRIWWWITVMSTSAIVSSQCPLRTKGRAQEQYSLLGRGAFVVARRVSIPWQWQFSVHHSRPLLWCNIFSGWLTVAVSWFRSSVVLTLSKQVQLSLFVWG